MSQPPPPPPPPPPFLPLAMIAAASAFILLLLLLRLWRSQSAITLASKSQAISITFSEPSKAKARPAVEIMAPSDPRSQLLEFFGSGDEHGPRGMLQHKPASPKEGQVVSYYFSVWRPCSMDALNMMMEGRATGKGLNVKGKSAKKGVLSGFVPFLQISEEAHKTKVATSPPEACVRVYYASEEQRDAARTALLPVLAEMAETARAAEQALLEEGELSPSARLSVAPCTF